MSGSLTALVTGAARGIGLAIADRLAADGYRVALLDVDGTACEAAAANISARHGGEMLAVHADVSDEAAVVSALRQVETAFGHLDALVNNAGIADPGCGPLESLSLEAWQRYVDVNLAGYFLVTREALPLLRKARGRNRSECHGAVVNIASTRAWQSEADTCAYAASKGGIVAFTHALAIGEGPAIRANSISPGWIDSRDADTRALEPLGEDDHAQHPAGRVGLPEDVAALAAFLLSDEAGFITGEDHRIDGGMTRRMIYR